MICKVISFILFIVLVICCCNVFEGIKATIVKNYSQSIEEIESENETIKNNNAEEIQKDNNVKEEVHNMNKDKIVNILLLGIDKEENASDTIMILSSNTERNTVKLVSIMRDTYVYLGEGMANKMNYAYYYGGVEGSINTINGVFNLDVSKYIKVTFDDLINIVDKLGGVDINVTENEREYINSTRGTTKLNHSGNVVLNGNQALAYSRIRKIDSDFYRTARQRNVMLAIFKKVKNMSIVDYPAVIFKLMDSVETNVSFIEALEIVNHILSLDESNLDEFRIPMDGTTRDNCEGVYHLDWDRDVNVKELHDYIYN